MASRGCWHERKENSRTNGSGRPLMLHCSVFNSNLKDKRDKRFQLPLNERPFSILKILNIGHPASQRKCYWTKEAKRSMTIIIYDFSIHSYQYRNHPNRNQQRNFRVKLDHRHPKCNPSNTRGTDGLLRSLQNFL